MGDSDPEGRKGRPNQTPVAPRARGVASSPGLSVSLTPPLDDTDRDEMIAPIIKEKSASTSQLAARLHGSIPPMLRIPDEILSYILELLTPCETSQPSMIMWDPKNRDDKYFPLFQSFISMNLSSRRIREIAIHTPKCWTNVVISLTKTYSTSPIVLESQLQRSKSLLVNLIIFVNVDNTRSNLLQLLPILQPHIYRCHRMEVCSGPKKLRMSESTQAIRDFGLVCPALRSVKFADHTGSKRGLIHRPPLIPFWQQHESQIESADIEFKLVIRIARHCPNLECFDWRFYDDDEEYNDTRVQSKFIEPLELLHLKKFKLGAEALAGGFPQLVAPRCELLSLSGIWYSNNNDWYFGDAQRTRQTFPALKRISFVSINGYKAKLHQFLSDHSHLEEILVRVRNLKGVSEAEGECELLKGLACLTTTSGSPTSQLPYPFLPALRMLWYSVEMHRLEFGHGISEAVAVLALALQQLLEHRLNLSITLALYRTTGDHTIEQFIELCSKFEGRFVVVKDKVLWHDNAPLVEPW
ncbi:hypothetical protein DL93DRAFT_2232614 [Clavulina sp. PMI_390]|nr:hypothetical protein DL93DRAFT_2232614 [Clavulina sp. PMI_390]